MQFERGQLFHIYNQGNNRQQVFFNRENYLYFLKKIRAYISPYASIFAWCLMPNHFHLMVLVNETEMEVIAGLAKNVIDWEYSSAIDYFGNRKGSLIDKKLACKYLDY